MPAPFFVRHVGDVPTKLRAPGGTRKIGHLSGCPSSLISNYKVLIAALHCRLAWKREGHGSQSLSALLELGRRLQDVAFIVFMVAFDSILRFALRPYVLLVQSLCEPAQLDIAREGMMQRFRDCKTSVNKIRRLLTVAPLCRQHATPGELARFLCAFTYSDFAQHFPGVLEHCTRLVYKWPT